MRRLHQNGELANVLLTQFVLGLVCCLSCWWAGGAFFEGSVAGFVSVFMPNALLAWRQQRVSHAPRLLMQSATKWVATLILMALSFGVLGVNPVSFFVTFGLAQLSFVVALMHPGTATKR
jgi:F0F1-type ATP synthase assembly protein I